MQPNHVEMTVLRDGYWDGTYPRRGETIVVEDQWVVTLEMAGFATRPLEPPRPEPRAKKGK